MLRLVSECRPKFAIFENVTELLRGERGRWFAKFLYDLAQVGYDAEWHCISASELGAAHHRDRVWIIAYPIGSISEGIQFQKPVSVNPEESRRRQYTRAVDAAIPANDYTRMRKDLDGFPEELDEIKESLKAYGNSVVPQIPELIGRAIMEIENG